MRKRILIQLQKLFNTFSCQIAVCSHPVFIINDLLKRGSLLESKKSGMDSKNAPEKGDNGMCN